MSGTLSFPTGAGAHTLGQHTQLTVATNNGGWVGTTAAGTTLALTDLLDDLGLPGDLWPVGVTISELTVSFVPETATAPKQVQVSFELAAECPFVPGLALRDVWVTGRRVEGANPSFDLEVGASITLMASSAKPLVLSVDGDYRSEGGVTVLGFAARIGEPVPVGALLQELVSAAGLGFEPPDAIADLQLKNAEITLKVIWTEAEVTGVSTRRTELMARCTVDRGGGTWEIIPGLLEVGGASLALRVADGRVTLDVQDYIEFCGAGWTVDVQAPSMRGQARLAPGDHKLSAFLAHFDLHAPDGLGDLALGWAVVQFDGSARYAALHFELKDVWNSEHFKLKDVVIDIAYQGGQGGGASGGLRARLDIGDEPDVVSLELAATHPGPGQGWTFSGSVTFTTPLTISGVARHFGVGDEVSGLGALADVGLVSLELGYATLTGTMHLGCTAKVNADTTLMLSVDVSRAAPSASGTAKRAVRLSGHLDIKGAKFDLAFQSDGNGDLLVGAYIATPGHPLTAADILSALGAEAPAGLPSVSLSQAVLAWERNAAQAAITNPSAQSSAASAKSTLLAADLDLAIDFSGLRKIPLVGEHLPANLSLGASMRPTIVTGAAATFDTAPVTALVPDSASLLSGSVPKGVKTHIQVRIGDTRIPFDSLTPPDVGPVPAQPPPPAPIASAASAPPPDNLAWISVQKSLGSVIELRRIGLGLKSPKLTILVDGSIKIQALTLDLLGLGITYDLGDHSVEFAFRGAGFSLSKPPLRISAAFMNVDGDFVGRAQVVTSKFGLSAVGGFSMVGGSPSLFLYGILDYPLGGPPFFFVEGLAAGFGVNRHLRIPKIEEVGVFPFVEDAQSPPAALPQAAGTDIGAGLGAQMQRLHDYISPARGEYFFAAGVKFNSFRILDGFVLALVSIDTNRETFRVDVVGTATLASPPKAKAGVALAWIEVDLLASFVPAEGSLIVQANLAPTSYVLTQTCHLHGGIAAGFWFSGEHAGDFVVSVGGYHPDFAVPKHYPVPARLGMDWQISSSVHASGAMYYALTPHALMFGFEFSATWAAGPVGAWFDLGLDFLLEFSPLHYDARGHIEIGASIDMFFGKLTVSAGASLHIWGPDFSGTADAHLGPFSVHLTFGAGAAKPPSLAWPAFTKAFFPPDLDKQAVSIVATGGLLSTLDVPTGSKAGTWWKVNPKDFTLMVESLMPVTDWHATDFKDVPDAVKLEIGPMGYLAWSGASFTATLTRDEHPANADVTLRAYTKPFPTAVWGPESKNHQRLVTAAGGFSVRPAAVPPEGRSGEITRSKLDYEVRGRCPPRVAVERLYDDLPTRSGAHRALDRQEVRQFTADPAVVLTRHDALMALSEALRDRSLDPAHAVVHNPTLADAFVHAPHVSRRASS